MQDSTRKRPYITLSCIFTYNSSNLWHSKKLLLHCTYIHKLQGTIFVCYTQHMKLDCVTSSDDALYLYVLWMGHAEHETEPSVWFPLFRLSLYLYLQWWLISVQNCKDHIWKMCMPLEYFWLIAKSNKTDWKKFVILLRPQCDT